MAVAKCTKSFSFDTPAADILDFEQRVRLRFDIELMEVLSIFGVRVIKFWLDARD
jgi:hypothetical protein